ncbi:MAG: hypothetical protein AB7K68_10250 [Bacteriovoracia bacterium]
MWDFFRQQNLRSANHWLLTLTFAFSPAPAFAAGTPSTPPITQKNAQAVAEDLNRKASDQSMQSSTTSAMKALMHFANSEMPSAVSNGMTAYGKYRNSENLDKLGDQNTLNEVSMVSFGNGASAASGVSKTPAKTNTSFRRLDPSFLRQGEAGKIADEFERQSGMKREDFLKEMSAVSEKKISRTDPQLMDKLLSRVESFASRIPNAQFRAKVEANIHKVPETVRTGLVAKAISTFSGFMAAASSDSAAHIHMPVATEAPKASPVAAAPTISVPEPELAAEVPSVAASSPTLVAPNQKTDMLGTVINEAIRTQAEDPSIFEIVTRRYRVVMPFFSKKAP